MLLLHSSATAPSSSGEVHVLQQYTAVHVNIVALSRRLIYVYQRYICNMPPLNYVLHAAFIVDAGFVRRRGYNKKVIDYIAARIYYKYLR